MADNVNITAGVGVIIATDEDASNYHYQRVKLTDGLANATTPINADIGAKANALRVCPANNITDATYIGNVKVTSGTVTTVSTVTSLTQMGGVAITMGEGGVGGGCQRVTLATDDDGVAHLATIAGAIAADAQAYGSGILCQGDDGTDRRAILVGTDGHVQVDVLSGGGGTEYTEDVATANPIVGLATMMERDDIIAALTPVEGDWASLRCSAEGALWVQDFNSDAILTAVQLIDNAIDGNYFNCNLNIAGTDCVGNSGVLAAGVLRVTIATDDECNNYLGTIDADTGNMVTALQLLDNAVDGNYLNVNLNVAGTDAAAGEGVISAQTQRVTIATDDDGVAHLATLAGAVAATHMQCDIVAGTVTTVSTVTSVTNLVQMGAQAISMGEGVVAAGCQRVTLATDDDGVAHLATIAGDTTAIETAIQIIDDWDATHAGAASADGPQIMGAGYSTGLPTDVGADADAARICTDRHGRVLAGLMPQWFNAVLDSADATAEGITVKAKTADRKIYIMSYVISSDVEGWIKLQKEDSTALTGKFWLKAGGGVSWTAPPNAPLIVDTVNVDLEVIAEAAGNISVTVTGYLAV